MTPVYDNLWINAGVASMPASGGLGAVQHSAVAVKDQRIAWTGPMAQLPGAPQSLSATVVDVGGRWITPGLVDCHTHLVFGGQRAREFELRLGGASYETIARQGGGIVSTVNSTRGMNDNALFDAARPRLEHLLNDGVTTVEIKSGYGLDTETEARMLRVARRLGEELPVSVRTTFLGAHTLPPEYRDNRQDYVDLVCERMLPQLADEGLVDAVDAFCEGIAFSNDETRRVFETATRLGIPVKLHAEQLSNSGGAALAAEFGALSADHLEHADAAGIAAMAAAGSVAVLLPGAYFMLRETRLPPVDLMRQHDVRIALATDCNPGTSPVLSLRLMAVMGCQLFGLTVTEALRGITCNAAAALGVSEDRGSIEAGKRADFVVWDVAELSELTYWLGGSLMSSVVRNGAETRKSAALR